MDQPRRTSLTVPRRGGVVIAAMLLLTLVFATSARAANNTYCTSGTTTYDGPTSGTWGTANGSTTTNWSDGLPDDSCEAVIPAGDTVTLTTSPGEEEATTSAGGLAEGLTIQGGATLIVEGVSSQGEAGNTSQTTTLTIGQDGLTIAQSATLDIEATDNSSPFTGNANGQPLGGSAVVTGDGSTTTPIDNAGTINASTSDPTYGEALAWTGELDNTGTLDVSSGTLTVQGENYPELLVNTGTVNVASGANYSTFAGSSSSITNSSGTWNNLGATVLYQGMSWIQSGGAETGQPVQLTQSNTLVDSAGAGSFEVDSTNCGAAGLTGTVPAGQTVSVVGVSVNCGGNPAQTSDLSLGGSSDATVTNDGTIELDAPGSGTTSGGEAVLEGGTLDNYGTLESVISDASWTNQLLVPLVNEAGGTVALTGGELAQTTGSTTTNDGTVTVGAGSTWLVQGGAFVNSGTVAPQLTSPTSLGQFNLTVGSTFTAGGTLAPALASGYTPAAGTEFPIIDYNGGSVSGTFATVTGGFSADYTKETANPAYVGVIYSPPSSTGTGSTGTGSTGTGSSGTAPRGTGSTGPTAKPEAPVVSKVSGGAEEIIVKLTCARSAASCESDTFTATADKKTVASGRGTLVPGESVTVDLKLNATGLKLLKKYGKLKVKLVIKASTRTLKTTTVTVTKPKPKATTKPKR